MPLTAEERAQLVQQIPQYEAQPEYAFLAEKKLLPQQRGLESFEDPPLLTQLRRAMFGLTQKEKSFAEQQQQALLPFQQEQEILGKLNAAKQFALQQPLGAMMSAFPGALQPEESQMRTRLEPLTAQTMQPPNVGSFSAAGPNNPAGRLLQGPPELIPTNAPPEVDSSQQFAYRFPTQPIRELNPEATITAGQLPIVQQLLGGHLTAPGANLVPPALQASRETPVEVAPSGTLVSKQGQPLYTAPGKPAKENEELQKFRSVLEAAGIPEQSQEGQSLYKAWATKIATHQPPIADIKMGDSLAKEIGPQMSASMNAALGSLDTLDAVDRARSALSKGLVTLGPTATIRNKINQVSQIMGVAGKDDTERLVNTRNVMRALAQFSLGARKQLKGQGQVSDFEGRMIIKAESGEIDDMTIPEMQSFLDVTDRLARRQYMLHQSNLEKMRTNEKTKDVAPFYEVPPLPSSSVAAIAPALADFHDPKWEEEYQRVKPKILREHK